MKNLLILTIAIFIALPVHGETVSDCVGLGLKAELSEVLCGATTIDGSITPSTDNSYDLGTASLEFKDAYFDGTVTTDNVSMPISVVAGANTACSTTCTGFCFFGVNTAATEADIVDCADATADECLCVE